MRPFDLFSTSDLKRNALPTDPPTDGRTERRKNGWTDSVKEMLGCIRKEGTTLEVFKFTGIEPRSWIETSALKETGL